MRSDGLRDDDPPYRTTLRRSGRELDERAPLVLPPKVARNVEQIGAEAMRQAAEIEATQARAAHEEATVQTMHSAEDIVRIVRRVASGAPFVRVDRLIEALSA